MAKNEKQRDTKNEIYYGNSAIFGKPNYCIVTNEGKDGTLCFILWYNKERNTCMHQPSDYYFSSSEEADNLIKSLEFYYTVDSNIRISECKKYLMIKY